MRGALLVAIVAATGGTVILAATPQKRTVTVGDSSLKPASVTIAVGGSVTWLDSGRRSHRITSDTRAFPAISLAPASRHTVGFNRTGRYRYHVDGRRKGLVIVVARAAGGEAWSGTFESHGTNDGTDRGGQICTATWKGTLAFTVAGER